MFHTLDRSQLLDEGFELGGIVHHHCQHPREKSVVRVDADGTEQDAAFLINNGGDVGHDAYIVVPHHTERNGILLALALARPFRLHDAIAETGFHLGGIRAILAVNLDAPIDGYETEHLVAINRVTALGELEVDALQVLVDDEDIVLEGLVVRRRMNAVCFCTPVEHFIIGFGLLFLHLHETVEDVVRIQLFVGYVLIEQGDCLVPQLLDETHHHGFIVF